MKTLQDFGVKQTQLGNIQGGCAQTGYKTSSGSTGTDTWCDKNGDKKMTKDEVYDYVETKSFVKGF